MWVVCVSAAYYSDLHRFDTSAGTWTSYATDRIPPRFGAGFAAVGGQLYLFGGEGYSGEMVLYGDCVSLFACLTTEFGRCSDLLNVISLHA